MLLFSLLGLLGTVITCVGIYGVMAYVVELRTTTSASGWPSGRGPEILSSILGTGAGLPRRRARPRASRGLALGALVSGLLFQVEPRDVGVFGWVSGALMATGCGGVRPRAARGARRSAHRAA